MTKRWNVLLAAFALSSVGFADGDAFWRQHISPITFSKSMDAFLGGKTKMFFVQPVYSWGDGFTDMGALAAYGTRPNGDDYKKATLFAASFHRWDPDSGDSSNWQTYMMSHSFTGKDDPYMAGVTLYYWNDEGFAKGMGGNYTVGTSIFGNDKDPGFMVGASANYAQMDPDSGPISRGAGFSLNIGRAISDTMMFEYDHTFASKFGGAPDWFFRTTWDCKPGTQIRLTVSGDESYSFEVGFVVNTK